MHGVHCKLELGFGDEIEIDKTAYRRDVIVLQFSRFNRSRMTLRHYAGTDALFDNLHHGRGRRAAEFAFELHSIPVPGIVTGSDHDATRGTLLFYSERDCRRWSVIVCQLDGNSAGRQDFCGDFRRALRCKSCVVANDHTLLWIFMLQDISGNRARYTAHIVEGKVVGDDPPPTVGTELDSSHQLSVVS